MLRWMYGQNGQGEEWMRARHKSRQYTSITVSYSSLYRIPQCTSSFTSLYSTRCPTVQQAAHATTWATPDQPACFLASTQPKL